MRVLGIDPGSETLGWGVVDGTGPRYSLVAFGTVKSNPKHQFSKRLLIPPRSPGVQQFMVFGVVRRMAHAVE